jgi:hypothetical protein
VLVVLGCGKSDKKDATKPSGTGVGSGGCVVPEPGSRLCGEDAIDWCNAHPGEQPAVQGNCDEILGRTSSDPQNKSSARTPDESNPPPYTPPSDSQSSPPPTEQSQAPAPDSGESGSSPPSDQGGHKQQYRCEEADAPDRYEPGCQGTLVPIG